MDWSEAYQLKVSGEYAKKLLEGLRTVARVLHLVRLVSSLRLDSGNLRLMSSGKDYLEQGSRLQRQFLDFSAADDVEVGGRRPEGVRAALVELRELNNAVCRWADSVAAIYEGQSTAKVDRIRQERSALEGKSTVETAAPVGAATKAAASIPVDTTMEKGLSAQETTRFLDGDEDYEDGPI